ncbi:MAG: HAD hydrolase family protein, partial [Pseudomonadota bacterium]
KRMQELGVETVLQGARDKGTALGRVLDALGVAAGRCAYVGDDEPDLAAMKLVALPVAVANAVARVRDGARYVTRASGGNGAVREVCELIVEARSAK